LINETGLGHVDFHGFVGLWINLLSNMNTKEILHFSFVFQLVFLLQRSNDIVDGGIFTGKEKTVISVDNDNAIVTDKQTRVNFGGFETFIKEALSTMLKPIICRLPNAIKVLLQFDTAFSVVGLWVSGLC
jgi:hypothetical protein